MPTKAVDGRPLTESKQLLDAWQEFLGRKFTCADIPGAAYAPVTADDDNDWDVTAEELEECLRVLHDNKAPGCDGIPIEAYRGSPAAKQELFAIVRLMWQTEVIPPAFVCGIFVMLYKKGPRENFVNYRSTGLMCHSYKLLSMLVLHCMQDAVESRLAETQAGFRRGCRDNVLLLRLLMDAVLRAGKQAVVTFIDYRAAFDTISHRFLDESLTAVGIRWRRRSARLDGSWGLGACLCTGELFRSIRVDGEVGAQVEGHACAHPGAHTSVDGSGGWGPWPPTQLPRMREEFSNVTRIDGAPSSLVPPGRRNFFLHFDSGHQHKPRHIAPPTLPDVLMTGR